MPRIAVLQSLQDEVASSKTSACAPWRGGKYPPPRRAGEERSRPVCGDQIRPRHGGHCRQFSPPWRPCPPMARRRRSAGCGGAGRRGSHRPPAAADPELWRPSRWTPATARFDPICTRPSRRCRKASRRARSWMWCSRATPSASGCCVRPWSRLQKKTCPPNPSA